jgi:hypothetical protein
MNENGTNSSRAEDMNKATEAVLAPEMSATEAEGWFDLPEFCSRQNFENKERSGPTKIKMI